MRKNPGGRGQYADVALHAGLICLNGPVKGMDLDLTVEMFLIALDELDRDADLVNQVLEITTAGVHLDVLRYALPPGDRHATGARTRRRER